MNKSRLLGTLSACVFVFLCTSASASLINVALTGTASQSSTFSAAVSTDASNAIDGNTGGDGLADPPDLLSHTNLELNAWWRVELNDAYAIDSIAIWNRTDGFQERLSDFTVSILDNTDTVVWSSVFSGTAGIPTTLSTSSTLGSAVMIQLNGANYLTLAEVQVFSAAVPIPAAVWLFGSGLFGLIGISRRKKIE